MPTRISLLGMHHAACYLIILCAEHAPCQPSNPSKPPTTRLALQVIARLDGDDRRKIVGPGKQPSPRDAVAASLSAAFQAAADAAASLAGPMVSNFSSFTSAAAASLPVQVMATQLQGAARSGHSTALASMAMVRAPLSHCSALCLLASAQSAPDAQAAPMLRNQHRGWLCLELARSTCLLRSFQVLEPLLQTEPDSVALLLRASLIP